MASIRFERCESFDQSENVDWDRLHATSDEEIEAQAREDGTADLDLTAVRSAAPEVDLPALHARLGLSVGRSRADSSSHAYDRAVGAGETASVGSISRAALRDRLGSRRRATSITRGRGAAIATGD